MSKLFRGATMQNVQRHAAGGIHCRPLGFDYGKTADTRIRMPDSLMIYDPRLWLRSPDVYAYVEPLNNPRRRHNRVGIRNRCCRQTIDSVFHAATINRVGRILKEDPVVNG